LRAGAQMPGRRSLRGTRRTDARLAGSVGLRFTGRLHEADVGVNEMLLFEIVVVPLHSFRRVGGAHGCASLLSFAVPLHSAYLGQNGLSRRSVWNAALRATTIVNQLCKTDSAF
jgi:hypothetical protein